MAVVGGAKVTDKIGVLDAFLERADTVLIGGAMCFPFFAAQGHDVGDSKCEDEGVEPARRALEGGGDKLELPDRPRRGPRVLAPTPRCASSTASTSPTAGWGSTSGAHSAEAYASVIARRRHGVLERADGRVRARAVRGRHARG